MKTQARMWSIILLFLFSFSLVSAQNPGEKWAMYAVPEEAGFSSQKLAEAKSLYDSLDAAALMVIYDGKVLVVWGDIYRRFMCHSVRKSFLSALYGIHVDDGTIDLDKTLADLKIDDKDSLTEIEKQATIRDLLKARSGVYHPAAYETPGMKALRPSRGSHAPGAFWYYNNWDFNVLCTILEQETGTDIFEDFKTKVANPLQMEDYRTMDGYHHLEPEHSVHPAYPFRMSARDMARFGWLYHQQGKWNGKEILSVDWIEASATPYSKTGFKSYMAGYGYLWWVSDDFKDLGLYSALGVGTQMISVLPGANMVIVQRVNTYASKQVIPDMKLFQKIIEAKVSPAKKNPELILLKEKSGYPLTSPMDREALAGYAGQCPVNVYYGDSRLPKRKVNIVVDGDHLVLKAPFFGNFKMFPLTPTKFFVEDMEHYGIFEIDDRGNARELTLFPTEKVADFYSRLLDEPVVRANVLLKNTVREKKDRCYFSESELLTMGFHLLVEKRNDEAQAIWHFAVQVYPRSSRLHVYLGEASRIEGNIEQAVQLYKKALELDPNNAKAKNMLNKLEKDK